MDAIANLSQNVSAWLGNCCQWWLANSNPRQITEICGFFLPLLAASWRPSQPLVFHVSKTAYFITNPSLPPGVRRRHLGRCICQMLHLHPDLEEISTIPRIGHAWHSPGFHMISQVFPCPYIISYCPSIPKCKCKWCNEHDVTLSIYEVRRLWLQQLIALACRCNMLQQQRLKVSPAAIDPFVKSNEQHKPIATQIL